MLWSSSRAFNERQTLARGTTINRSSEESEDDEEEEEESSVDLLLCEERWRVLRVFAWLLPPVVLGPLPCESDEPDDLELRQVWWRCRRLDLEVGAEERDGPESKICCFACANSSSVRPPCWCSSCRPLIDSMISRERATWESEKLRRKSAAVARSCRQRCGLHSFGTAVDSRWRPRGDETEGEGVLGCCCDCCSGCCCCCCGGGGGGAAVACSAAGVGAGIFASVESDILFFLVTDAKKKKNKEERKKKKRCSRSSVCVCLQLYRCGERENSLKDYMRVLLFEPALFYCCFSVRKERTPTEVRKRE